MEPPQHASSRTGCPLPTLRRLPCANLGEAAGRGCRRPRQEKDRAGSERHPKPCTSPCSRRFSLSLTPRLERCCCRKVAMRRAAPSRLSPRVPTPECRTMSSESCCSADSAYLSRSPRNAALAGDSWTCTATTGRPAHRWECWRGELAPWSGHLQGGGCQHRIACRPPRPQPRCARERRTPYRGGRQRPPPMAGRTSRRGRNRREPGPSGWPAPSAG